MKQLHVSRRTCQMEHAYCLCKKNFLSRTTDSAVWDVRESRSHQEEFDHLLQGGNRVGSRRSERCIVKLTATCAWITLSLLSNFQS